MAKYRGLKRLREIEESLVSEIARLVFMMFCFFVATESPPLYSAMLVRIPGIVYIVLKDLIRTWVRVPGIVYIVLKDLYAVLQSVDKVYCALGSAVVLVIGAVMYFSSRKKQSRGVFSFVQENAIEEAPAEMECENDVVVKPSDYTCSNLPEASPQIWKPISELNVKLELELVSPVESLSKRFPSSTHSVLKPESCVGSLSKRFPSSTHSVLKPDSSVGSFSAFHRSRSTECKAKLSLRRSTRIRNKVISEECKVEAPVRILRKKVISEECKAKIPLRRSSRIVNKVIYQKSLKMNGSYMLRPSTILI